MSGTSTLVHLHTSSHAGNLHSLQPLRSSPPIIVGNGATLPVTHQASSTIATDRSPLHLNNILVSPSIVKNLISLCSLTRDNNVSVEFDLFGFSIKDLPTRTEILRCNSAGAALYPLGPSLPEAHVTTTPTIDVLAHASGSPWSSLAPPSAVQHRLHPNSPISSYV